MCTHHLTTYQKPRKKTWVGHTALCQTTKVLGKTYDAHCSSRVSVYNGTPSMNYTLIITQVCYQFV